MNLKKSLSLKKFITQLYDFRRCSKTGETEFYSYQQELFNNGWRPIDVILILTNANTSIGGYKYKDVVEALTELNIKVNLLQ